MTIYLSWHSALFSIQSVQCWHAQMVKNSATSHITNYIDIFTGNLNLEGHLYCCIGSKVTAILLNGWILPTGGVVSGRVCPAACAAGLFLNIYLFRRPKLTGAVLQTRWSLICWFGLFVTIFLPLLYCIAKLKRFEMVLTVITRICRTGLGYSISQSIWKFHHWWSSLGRVCTCRLRNRLVLTHFQHILGVDGKYMWMYSGLMFICQWITQF